MRRRRLATRAWLRRARFRLMVVPPEGDMGEPFRRYALVVVCGFVLVGIQVALILLLFAVIDAWT